MSTQQQNIHLQERELLGQIKGKSCWINMCFGLSFRNARTRLNLIGANMYSSGNGPSELPTSKGQHQIAKLILLVLNPIGAKICWNGPSVANVRQ